MNRYAIPSEFTDEDVWFVFFRKRNLKVMGVGVLLTIFLWKFLGLFGIPIVGLVAGSIFTVLTTGATMISASDDFMKGGSSLTLDVIIRRRYIRKKTATIYVKGYGKDIGNGR